MATVVFVHAHPDDEALLTSGTMAMLAQREHNVIHVVATDGAAGLTNARFRQDQAAVRQVESLASGAVLGVTQTIFLEFPDSGLHKRSETSLQTFSEIDVQVLVERLESALDHLHVDAIVGYDVRGGYGHPDHIQVHNLVAAYARKHPEIAWYEATRPPFPLPRAVTQFIIRFNIPAARSIVEGYENASDIVEVDVSSFTDIIKASMRSHKSQLVGGLTPRSLRIFVSLPNRVFRRFFGTEVFNVQREPNVKLRELLLDS